jgi:hypothetical protein
LNVWIGFGWDRTTSHLWTGFELETGRYQALIMEAKISGLALDPLSVFAGSLVVLFGL